VAPSQLADNVVTIVEQITDLDWMISTLDVILGIFLLVVVRSEDLLLLVILFRTRRLTSLFELIFSQLSDLGTDHGY